ncbi:sensor histidine kinase [Anoxybacillus sp. D401a]|uniref:sensor histidine kinase n=1 Tax=Anoxybacillus sp. D401a TaxID=575112 RepID=UPI003D33EDD9
MKQPYYIVLFVGFFFLLIGKYTYVQKPTSIVVQRFLTLMCVSAIAMIFSIPSSRGIQVAQIVEALAVCLAPYVLLEFFKYFPSSRRPKFFHAVSSIAKWAGIVCFVTYTWGNIVANEPSIKVIARLFIVLNIIMAVCTCVVLIAFHLGSNSKKVKNDLYVLILGLCLSFAPMILFSFVPSILFKFPSIPFYYTMVSIIFFPLTLSYLLTKQGIADWRVVAKQIGRKIVILCISLLICNIVLFTINYSLPLLSINTFFIFFITIYQMVQEYFTYQTKQITKGLTNKHAYSIQEYEKWKLAMFLHDEILQELIVIFQRFQLRKNENDDKQIYEMLRDKIHKVREMCENVYPMFVEHLGLENSLYGLRNKIKIEHHLDVEVYYDLGMRIIPLSLQVTLYRIIRELAYNAVKHAEATLIIISLWEEDEMLHISVEDDGKGFSAPTHISQIIEKHRFGLASIEKQLYMLGGRWDIYSDQQLGTRIFIMIPFEEVEKYEDKSITS